MSTGSKNKRKNTGRTNISWWSSHKPMLVFIIVFACIGVYLIVNSFAYRTIGDGTGTFNAYCDYSHRSNDDPIVFPNQVGAAHSHDFFGSTSTNAFSTTQSIQQSTTSCLRPTSPNAKDADKSAYWVPTLYVNDQPVQAKRLSAMYKADYREVQQIEAFPAGLKVIAGTATGGPQGINGIRIWYYACHVTATLVPGNGTTAPTCAEHTHKDGSFNLYIRFPDCWDGVNLDSTNHKSHMAYSSQKTTQNPVRKCPPSHPKLVPSLELVIQYPTTAGPTTRLSSGNITTAHADFMNGWNQAKLVSLVNNCLRIDNYCGGQDTPVIGHAGNEVDRVPAVTNKSTTSTTKANNTTNTTYGSGNSGSGGGNGTVGGSNSNAHGSGGSGYVEGTANPHSLIAGQRPGAARTVYAVTIKVVDRKGKPLGNAKVVIGDRVAYSDDKGVAVFNDMVPGSVKVKASANGGKGSNEIEVVDNGQPTEVQEFMVNVSDRPPSVYVALVVGTIAGGLLVYRSGAVGWLRKKVGV